MPLAPLQPGGTLAYAGAKATHIWRTMRELEDVFVELGASPVLPSALVSYRDAEQWLELDNEQRIRFIDRRSGDTISLRADLTTQVLALTEVDREQVVFATGSVYREDLSRRERLQATFEVLACQDPDAQLLFALQAILRIVSTMDIRGAKLVYAYTDRAQPAASGKLVQPAANDSNWFGDYTQEVPIEGLDVTAIAAEHRPTIIRDNYLPCSRRYYAGMYWRLYTDEQTPLLSGGQYTDPRCDARHVGFSIDVEQLARHRRHS